MQLRRMERTMTHMNIGSLKPPPSERCFISSAEFEISQSIEILITYTWLIFGYLQLLNYSLRYS